MGCGAVCGIQSPSSSQYLNYAKAKLLQLFPRINICKPLLTQQTFLAFTARLQSDQNQYVLKVAEKVNSDEEVDPNIMEKWRIMLYGLDKHDEKYKKCLSFQVRNGKQQVTNSQNLINNSGLIQNKSYHQLKPNTQYHECFTQIEKDLNRTFEFKQQKKKIFENILKRISNYFPSMGYTQGVNFVVGYLLIIGFSESDTFWMFSHLALNQRYLILGLYEDGFPLAYIYTTIFKNMLLRLDRKLHDHLYLNLMLDESIWIFKWFITYYIYSFPLPTIKYVWNLVVELGGIALVYYALAIVMHIRAKLLEINDPCDISEFLQGLKELNQFNELVKMNEVVTKVYELRVTPEDLGSIKDLKPSIYKAYYQNFDEIVKKDANKCDPPTEQSSFAAQESPLSRIIYAWYEKIMAERVEFQSNSLEKERSANLPSILQSEYMDLEKSINILEEKILQNQSIKLGKVQAPPQDHFFGDLIHNEPFTVTLRDILPDPNIQEQEQHEQPEQRSRNITKLSYDMEGEINEVDEESDSNNEELEEVSYHLDTHPPKSIDDIPDDIFHQIQKQSTHNFPLRVNTIIGHADSRKRTIKEANPKANNLKIVEDKRTGLALAAQNILCNLSVTNSQYSSNSSKNASFKPKKHKENNLFRYNKNGKVRTEEVSQPSMDPSSSRESSLDHHTDKESFSGMTHRNNNADRPSINDRRTQQDFMISSQGPEKLNATANPSKELTSEIEIFNGDGLFKKKKKVYNRNSNIISINQNIGKSSQKIEEIDCYSKRSINERNKNFTYTEEESLDTILYSLPGRKTSQQHQKEIDAMIYEIESIK